MTGKYNHFKKHVSFENNILILGFGAIGQCILLLLLRHLKIKPEQIIIIEASESENILKPFPDGIKYFGNIRIKRENLIPILSKYLNPGDFLINVSVNIACLEVLPWCQAHQVLYVDTSIEEWEDQYYEPHEPIHARTYYQLQLKMREQANINGPTAIVTHGANPGLVNHFVKAALIDLAGHLEVPFVFPKNKKEWAALAMKLGVKVIHISERDTQVSGTPKMPDEFVNTWSVEGFWAEGIGPSEMGWGTHEPRLPADAHLFEYGPGNCVYFERSGIHNLIRSWVPEGGTIHGFMLQHNETVTLSDFLTVWNGDGAVYRPSVSYAYLPCDAALASVFEMRMKEFRFPEKERIMKDELTHGMDELGVLLMGPAATGWWYGSQLSIGQTRRLIGPGHNATILQVAAPLLSAVVWAIKNPDRGYCEPEDLPHGEILEIARPYLGTMVSTPTDWSPLKNRQELFDAPKNEEEPWAFENFRVK